VKINAKPETIHGKIAHVLTTGSGSGSFFVQGHRQDRDQVLWFVHKVKGEITLQQGGKLLARLKLTGGTGYEPDGPTFRTVALKGKLLGGKFHCARPNAYLTLDDVNTGHGNTDDVRFGACSSYADWRGLPAKVSITVKKR
jgi:hypothetical protein